MLLNHLLDAIDVDLLSDSQRIAYLKAIQPFVMPKMESVKQQTSLEIGDNLQWLMDTEEEEIDNEISKRIGIGNFTGKGLA